MPRQDLIQIRRGTRAAFNALTSGNKLEAGELGAATDTEELLVGLGPTLDPFVVGSGGGGGGGVYFVRVDTGLDDSLAQSYSYIGALQTAGTRGQYALDIQSYRTAGPQIVTAKYGLALGQQNTCGNGVANDHGTCHAIGANNSCISSGMAIGNSNTINLAGGAGYSVAVGSANTINDNNTYAFGQGITSTNGFQTILVGTSITHTAATPGGNERTTLIGGTISATGDFMVGLGIFLTIGSSYSVTLGFFHTNNGDNSAVVGIGITNSGASSYNYGNGTNSGASSVNVGVFENTIANTLNISNNSARIRGYGDTGQLSLSIQNRATAYTHTAAVVGSEPDNTLRPGMFAIRRNGMQFIIDINDAGTIRSLVLGTAT